MPNAIRTSTFKESKIREMTRIAKEYGSVNLGQGFPDFPMPQSMKDAACEAIQADINQYAITWGSKKLRDAITGKYARRYGLEINPEKELTVACGATEATAAVFLALFNPGDEVIIFEPFYENYGPDAILCEANPVFVGLIPPNWDYDEAKLRAAITPKTRAIVVNSPQNPTGHVFSRSELQSIANICIEHNLLCITDDPYEYIIFKGEHICIATLPGMKERTITISSLSKTFSITGWRIGYAIANEEMSGAIRKVHDFLTVGAPAPLMEAAAIGYSFPDSYYEKLSADYLARRDFIAGPLRDAGFKFALPDGAYYIFADITDLTTDDDVTFAKWLAKEGGIATVPGSSFYHPGAPEGRRYTRFAFCKTQATLEAAAEKLSQLKAKL